jgi:predicted transposase YdaD
LLKQVAAAVDMIEETQEQQNISACVQLLAGLRFDENLIQQFFSEEVMQESVIYQRILQKGEARLMLRILTRLFGDIAPEIEQRIRSLSTAELENLGEALLNFSNTNDLITWLESNS